MEIVANTQATTNGELQVKYGLEAAKIAATELAQLQAQMSESGSDGASYGWLAGIQTGAAVVGPLDRYSAAWERYASPRPNLLRLSLRYPTYQALSSCRIGMSPWRRMWSNTHAQ